MANPNHHLCIHGHLYQPPRENPWLGVVESQPSAAPFHDWNERITAECYGRLARSALCDEQGRIVDLYNCYARMSFNVGPTLFDWLRTHHPRLCEDIGRGEHLGRETHGGHAQALAQVYNHVILPLADARDRHTQILWGLRHFEATMGRPARGMWLSECAIDAHTIRALIAHGVRYVILSPYQASRIRPFGRDEWKDVSDGSVDTRHPYRVHEVDGGGRTHFNRWIDVVFYNPTLSTRISFEHLLTDPERLEAQVREHFDAEATLPQLVTIATDGEIYGHHEPGGEASLARLFHEVAPRNGLTISNIEQYLEANPPCWEAMLWNGEEGRGTSWSCPHGVGRWIRDCGCSTGGPHEWSQDWRTGLREAFDRLRDQVKHVFANELGSRLRDPWDARDDYLSVLLDRSEASRRAFLNRHAAGPLSEADRRTVWRLMEAATNAMMMYTSCGWFFAELSGIEPVQNMRYALRAAELAQPFTDTDLQALLTQLLAQAEGNLGQNGTEIFARDVLSTRYPPEVIAANHALKRMLELRPPEDVYDVTFEEETRKPLKRGMKYWGRLSFTDPRTTESFSFKFYCVVLSAQTVRAIVAPGSTRAFLRRLLSLSTADLAEALTDEGIDISVLPERDRDDIVHGLMRAVVEEQEKDIRTVYDRSLQYLQVLQQNRLPVPEAVRVCAEHVMERRFMAAWERICALGECPDDERARLKAVRDEAQSRNIEIRRSGAQRILIEYVEQRLLALHEAPDARGIKQVRCLLDLAEESGLELRAALEPQRAFWQACQDGAAAALGQREDLQAIAVHLGFNPDVIDAPSP